MVYLLRIYCFYFFYPEFFLKNRVHNKKFPDGKRSGNLKKGQYWYRVLLL